MEWNKNKVMFDQFGLENTFIVFVYVYFIRPSGLVNYPYTNTTQVFSPDWSNTHLFLL